MPEIMLDGNTLDGEALWRFCLHASNPHAQMKISLSDEAKKRIEKAQNYLAGLAASKETVYGINTGFGYFARTKIAPEKIAKLQYNIIVSHACGVGEYLSRELTLCMWLILLNSVCRGHRGLGLEKVEHIIGSLEAGMLACVPSRGSVGASGDLAPTAHAVLALLGEGKCTLPDGDSFKEIPAKDALDKLGMEPLWLGPKEGLALINGTQLTAAMAVKTWNEGRIAMRTANLAVAMNIEAMRASHDMLNPRLLQEHRQQGTLQCGQAIANWLGGETEIHHSHEDCDKVQDPYSIRCAPQVHGAVWEELDQARDIINREINSTTDNPLLFPDEDEVVHGGNFHAIYPARVNDRLASALTTLANISERRINMAMKSDKSDLPNFLIREGGLNSGFMMAQTTAAALVSECKALSMPASVDSIPTNNDQEDHVSMGPIAGIKAMQIAQNCRYVLAIELLDAAQAIDMLRPLKTSPRLEKAHALIRRHVSYMEEDRFLGDDIEKIAQLIHSGALLEV